MPSASPRRGGQQLHHGQRTAFPSPGKVGSPADPWVAISDSPGEGSEWEKDQNCFEVLAEIHWGLIPGS